MAAPSDSLTGSPGDDASDGDPGDGVDTVEGGGGNDTASVGGTDAAESFTVAANGSRASVEGRGGNVVDMDDVETANFIPRGGADAVDVPNALPGTDLTGVSAYLGADGSATMSGLRAPRRWTAFLTRVGRARAWAAWAEATATSASRTWTT